MRPGRWSRCDAARGGIAAERRCVAARTRLAPAGTDRGASFSLLAAAMGGAGFVPVAEEPGRAEQAAGADDAAGRPGERPGAGPRHAHRARDPAGDTDRYR